MQNIKILIYQKYFVVLISILFLSNCEKKNLPTPIILPIQKVELPPKLTIFTTPTIAEYLGDIRININAENTTECKIESTSILVTGGYIDLFFLKKDTTIFITCIGLGGKLKDSVSIKVAPKPKYMKYLDTLTSGSWEPTINLIKGLNGFPNKWDTTRYVKEYLPIKYFYRDSTYKNLNYKEIQNNEVLGDRGIGKYSITKNDFEKRMLYLQGVYTFSNPHNYEIMKLTKDSLILYTEDITYSQVILGDPTNRYYNFPTIMKYIHRN